jgi:hypothetical protein
MSKKKISIFIFAFLTLVLPINVFAQTPEVTWNVQTVDEGYLWGGSLALSPDGTPNICYVNYSGTYGNLIYSYLNGSNWIMQVVDSGIVNYVCPSLAIDSDGNAHISYYKDGLVYASLKNSQWSLQIVDTDLSYTLSGLPSISKLAELVLDKTGDPHICYTFYYAINNAIEESIKYASWNGSDWNIQTVDSGELPTLALDSKESPTLLILITTLKLILFGYMNRVQNMLTGTVQHGTYRLSFSIVSLDH